MLLLWGESLERPTELPKVGYSGVRTAGRMEVDWELMKDGMMVEQRGKIKAEVKVAHLVSMTVAM